ncbi:MAG: EMC3/TMCO1 family protein [Candidatus Hodarchaeales archaeon]|jgi:uncharacterized membrane protein (DUF106 family)
MFILENLHTILINLITSPIAILQGFPPTEPPLSSIFILVISFLVSLMSTLVSRKMIDIDKLQRLTRESKKYNKMKTEMLKTADKKLKLKYERNADRMKKVQSELSMMNMKPLLIMFLPMIIFFGIFSSMFSFTIENIAQIPTFTQGNLPAVIPIALPEAIILPIGRNAFVEGWGFVFVPNYVWWYFGGSIAFSSILRKISGLQPD